MRKVRLLLSISIFITVTLCQRLSRGSIKLSRDLTDADIPFNITCYSFFGEFMENGSFAFIEPLTAVGCNPRVRHCFVEFYRLAYYTWFNGQCDNSFACIHESDYAFTDGCQATFHGGDRCCCSSKLCNFDLILKERPNFAKYLPKRQAVKSEDIPLEPHCGRIKAKSKRI